MRRASPLLGEACFVLYGDSYLPVDFGAVEAEFWASSRPALMTVLYNRDRWDKSNVLFVDGKLLEYNKAAPRPDFAYHRLRTDHSEARDFRELSSEPSRLTLRLVYHQLSLEGRLHGYEVFNRFYEIGSPNGLKEAHDFFEMEKRHMTYAQQHIAETIEIASKIDLDAIEKMADLLAQVKADDGRIFFLGVGGSAGNCGHAVNDFRKIVGIEAYAPTDNVSELTARTNDEGWATIFVEWLKVSKLQAQGRTVHLLGRRRQSGEEHQPQPR